ncbi:MAG: hypothetical protein ACOY4W_04755 [Thermodesulfobacteriota bacterium]
MSHIPLFDERSRAFNIRDLIDTGKPRSYTWRCDIHLDQGRSSACTGFAVAHEAMAYPVPVSHITNVVAKQIYRRAKQLDQYPGEAYAGSSVLGAVKAGKERGWYTSYYWAFSEMDLRLAVSWKGPAIIGIPWPKDMRKPGKTGIITSIGGGGTARHAILVKGFNVNSGLYTLHGSYGPLWAHKGDCYLHHTHMAQLLRQQGECCIPIVRGKGK